MKPRNPALQGVRTLDLSRVLAGPWCTMTLGDLGADVIKIENPTGGDDTRGWGPAFVEGESAYYLCANCNKRSVAVDISSPQGQHVIREFAAQCDVVVENFKAGALTAMASTTSPCGRCDRTSFIAPSPATDALHLWRTGLAMTTAVQAAAGLMSVTGEPMANR
jgi:crotonobetainyl-CoA:carnitine CoA-transferase CaiB-like acyl-CoA transferase